MKWFFFWNNALICRVYFFAEKIFARFLTPKDILYNNISGDIFIHDENHAIPNSHTRRIYNIIYILLYIILYMCVCRVRVYTWRWRIDRHHFA